MATLAELVGEVLDGKYRIEKKLGQGGMGAVFLATHLGTDRPVAVKVMSPAIMVHKNFVERFKLEAKAAGRLRHPNVINVTDFGFAELDGDEIAYLVMEFLDGCTLGDLLKKRPLLPLSVIVDIVEQVCAAIDKAHQQGILHRDLKPDNIWLQPDGRGNYHVKVLDFGLAKLRNTASPASNNNNAPRSTNRETIELEGKETASEQEVAATLPEFGSETKSGSTFITESDRTNLFYRPSQNTPAKDAEKGTNQVSKRADNAQEQQNADGENLTSAGAMLGTPLYMSPEQCVGGDLDGRADIYSLGVIVYQMLTGDTPFRGNMFSLAYKHTKEAPPPIREKRSDLSEEIASLVMSALAKTPAERPVSAAAFAVRLRAQIEGETTLVREAFELYRKYFKPLMSISMSTYAPLAALYILLIVLSAASAKSQPSFLLTGFIKLQWLFLPLVMFANSVNTAGSASVIEKLRLQPNSNVKIRPIEQLLLKRFAALATTAIKNGISVFLNIFKLLIPGLRVLVDHSLYPVIVIVEERQSTEALRRSKELVDRIRPQAISILMRDLFTAAVALFAIPIMFVAGNLIEDLDPNGSASLLPRLLLLSFPMAFIILVHPLIAAQQTVLYYRLRRAGGELFNESSSEVFESLDAHVYRKTSYIRPALLSIVLLLAIVGWAAVKNPALEFAARKGYINTVSLLLALGADSNYRAKDYSGNETTPLISAAARGDKEIVAFLLAKGADINAKTNNGWTALLTAASIGRLPIADLLIKSGADIHARNDAGETALICAAKGGHSNIIARLVSEKADVNAADNRSRTPLMFAAWSGNTAITRFLLENGADVQAKGAPIGLRQSRKALDKALKATAAVLRGDYSGSSEIGDEQSDWTALMQAVISGGDPYMVRLLLENGVAADARNGAGKTALMLAVSEGESDSRIISSVKTRVEIIKLLLDAGADVNAKDNQGNTALMLSGKNPNIDIIKTLRDAGAKTGIPALDRKTEDQ